MLDVVREWHGGLKSGADSGVCSATFQKGQMKKDIAARTYESLMNWISRNRERQRFYLLPGQGGRPLRRKRKVFLVWSLIVGMLVSGVIAALIFWSDRASH